MSTITTISLLSPSTSSKYEHTVDKIKYRLQNNKIDYKVISNDAPGLKSKCWNVFGFPAKKNEIGDFQPITGFVSCRQCYLTFSYTPTTGTRHLNSHTCVSHFLTLETVY
jgi:hypothetical protein